MTVFVIAAVVGFKASTWVVVGALAGHGVLDVVHGSVLNIRGCQCGGRPFVSPTISEPQAASPGSSHAGVDRAWEPRLASFVWIEGNPHERNHQGTGNELLIGPAALGLAGAVRRRQRLGGILNYYHRAA
jgi:hypothetical protein